MRHADLPAFPSLTGPLPAWGSAAVASQHVGYTQPLQTYSPLGQEVVRDVQQFIQEGAGVPTQATAAHASWLAVKAARQMQLSKAREPAAQPVKDVAPSGAQLQPEQQAFLQRIGPWAQKAAQRLGISARSVMAHAALESGWGKRPLRDAQGADVNNLFGIKATTAWQGRSVQALTSEVDQGVVVKQVQPFRQYADLDDTFADYVQLLARSPRYQAALHTGDDVQAFASALAAGGYATDPQYADKLVQVSRGIPAQP